MRLSTTLSSDRPQAIDGTRRSKTLPRLSERKICQVIADYKAGKTIYELAVEHSCHRTTISAVLKRRGVVLRGATPTAEQVNEMIRLYESGLSLAKVGQRSGFHASTVLVHLRNASVTTRSVRN